MKKYYYKKIVTWEQKPDYFGILCCFAFIGVGFFMCFLALYEYGVPIGWWLLLGIFILMIIFGIKKLEENLPKGKKIRYKKIR